MSDLDREGLEAAADALKVTLPYTYTDAPRREVAAGVVRAYLSSSQSLTDEEREAVLTVIKNGWTTDFWEEWPELVSARAKLSRGPHNG